MAKGDTKQPRSKLPPKCKKSRSIGLETLTTWKPRASFKPTHMKHQRHCREFSMSLPMSFLLSATSCSAAWARCFAQDCTPHSEPKATCKQCAKNFL